jgi:cupin fold WbuC family metalloprotein
MFSAGNQLLDELTSRALASPRLRINHNLHPDDQSKAHRLLNAIEPGSYIRPHRHLDKEKDETFVIMRGMLAVLTFSDSGQIADTALLAPDKTLIVNIPHGVYHTAISLAPGTVFFESKAGPYLPFSQAELPDWAPEPDTPEAANYMAKLCATISP